MRHCFGTISENSQRPLLADSCRLKNDRLLDATKVPIKHPQSTCFYDQKPVQLSMNRLGTFSYDHRLRTGQHPRSAS